MKVERMTKTIFIKASNNDEFERKLNEAKKGKLNPVVQVFGLYEGVVLYEEIIFDEDELEECFGVCKDCPYFEESTDKRRKWHFCTKHGKKVRAESNACQYIRKEEESVSELKGQNERVRPEDCGRGLMAQDITAEGVQPYDRPHSVHRTGKGEIVGVITYTGRGVIRGGARC